MLKNSQILVDILDELYIKGFIMNLHEECLLKYLSNPLDLANSTEMLKLNNCLIEKNLFGTKRRRKSSSAKCNIGRI